MDMNNDTLLESCSRFLRQAAWRLQYKTRTQQFRESFSLFDYQGHENNFDMKILSDIYVKELLDILPSAKCRYIIHSIIIEEKTENEVALELQISQQAVNKWKRKGLNILRQNLNHL